MQHKIDYRKYKGIGRPRLSDYRRGVAPFEHETYEAPSFDWAMAFGIGLMLAVALGAFFAI